MLVVLLCVLELHSRHSRYHGLRVVYTRGLISIVLTAPLYPTQQTPTKITPKRFSIIIEELVRTKRLTHFEAVMYYCEQNGLEAHTITKWIDKGMREKIQYNAEELNYLPKTSSLF